MKKFLLIIPTVLLFAACSYQDYHTNNTTNSDNLTAEEAMLYYNRYCADKYTRSSIDERLPFVLGDAEWLWDCAEGSSYDNKSAIDIPLSGGYQYVVYRKQADETYYSVHTSSKVVAVQDDTTGNISFYIRVSIPDRNDTNSSTESLNYEDRASFSGLEYYITIDGCPAAIVKFENGVQTDGVFLGDTSISEVSRLCKFAELFRGLCIGRVSETSRTDTNIGKVTGRFYDDVAGCWYSYIDIDGDGIADAITGDFDPVVITPEQNLAVNNGTGEGGSNAGSSGTSSGNSNAGVNPVAGTNINLGTSLGSGASGAGGTGGAALDNDGNSTAKNKNDSENENSNNSDVQLPIIKTFKNKNFVDPTILINKITIDNPTWDGLNISNELLSPIQAKDRLLQQLSETNPIVEFINSSDIPIYPSSVLPEGVEIHSALAVDLISKTIYYTDGYNNLSNAGRLLAIFHEYMHLYLNSKDHNLMIESLEYQQGLVELFPDMTVAFYDVMQYAGCESVAIKKNIQSIIYVIIDKFVFLKTK